MMPLKQEDPVQNISKQNGSSAQSADEEVEAIRRHCEEKLGVGFAVNNAFAEGGEGAVELANLVVDTIEKKPSEPLNFSYSENDSVEQTERSQPPAGARVYRAS